MLGEGVELVSVVETSAFSSQADEIWSDEEREEFVNFIAANPEAGRVITDTGGVRKIRWAIAGRGKRSGARVIYFFYNRTASIYLLMVYSKNVRQNLSPRDKKLLRAEVAKLKKSSGTKKDVPNE